MKTELRAVPHHFVPDTTVIEVWREGQFIATIVADGHGVRVISKLNLMAHVPGMKVTFSVGGQPANTIGIAIGDDAPK